MGDKVRPLANTVDKHTIRIKGVESKIKEIEPEVLMIREIEGKQNR